MYVVWNYGRAVVRESPTDKAMYPFEGLLDTLERVLIIRQSQQIMPLSHGLILTAEMRFRRIPLSSVTATMLLLSEGFDANVKVLEISSETFRTV